MSLYPSLDEYPENYRLALSRLGVTSSQTADALYHVWEDGRSAGMIEAWQKPKPAEYAELDLVATLRQQLAADILRTLVASSEFYNPETVAKRAVETADALLGALK